ncbi:hypothetical protein NYZ99_04800 [Maribacter litopenaei]|uniref:Uncharacterized protein n=1 Tax=Maribacter litopenaei TaxID=2976127 RepID=A0ABY5YA81_9FLAO|nr:hypothetical protein [Maribacter litopenaei]UWX55746.1 hypothetical protein NYZ99_04800 [Maribacter litopenaei]
MGKTRNLNGIPGNLALSYLSTLGYYDGGYMADWLNYIARDKNVKEIEIDILNSGIEPVETDIRPLKADLKKLRGILEKELSNNGFEMDFIKKAVMKFEIPIDNPRFKNTVYCYPFIEDENGKIYKPKKRIIETAYEVDFNPIKKLRMKTEQTKKNWIDRIKEIWN